MTLSWRQSGVVDNYIVSSNDSVMSSLNITSVGNVFYSTLTDLLVSGAYYCVSVIAVSGGLHSLPAMICNHSGELLTVVVLSNVWCLYISTRDDCSRCSVWRRSWMQAAYKCSGLVT